MGGKRYYCDYCDRSFKDAQGARQKHLISLQHIQNREEHYRKFKDPEEILKEEAAKNPCTRYMQYGECHFGNSCRYSHYTPQMIQQLHNIIAAREEAKRKVYDPDPEKIIKEFFEDTVDPVEVAETEQNLWTLPPELQNVPNLPPSLQPITYKNFTHSDFPEWGWR